MRERLGITCCYFHQKKWWRQQTVSKHLYLHLYHKYGVTFFTISVLSNKFSPPVPSAFGHLPYTDDRNYRSHLQLIYLWWSPDDRGSVCPIYSRPCLWITDQYKDPKQARKFKVVYYWIVGVEFQNHSFIAFGRLGITLSIFVIVVDVVIRNESLTVSLYPSGCGEDEVRTEGKVYARTAIPTQIKRIRKLFFSPPVNTTGMTRNATYSIKTNSLTIFIPSTFYLISCWSGSKQKSSGKLQSSHQPNISRSTTAVYDALTLTATNRFLKKSTCTDSIWQSTKLSSRLVNGSQRSTDNHATPYYPDSFCHQQEISDCQSSR